MSLTAREVKAVVEELQPLLGARLETVRVHAERALTLALQARGREALLLLSAEADATRLHAAEVRPPQPETPYGWQALLRRELEGARLAALECRPGDRVVLLRFERATGPRALVAELTGRHGNLFLLDGAGTILASAARNLSSRRELVAGRPWVPPAPRPPGDEPPPEVARFAPEPGAAFPLSGAIERHYLAVEKGQALAEGRRRLREPLRAALARSRRALEKLAEEAARVPAAESDRRFGDLLKVNLHAVERGQRQVELTEWTTEGARPVQVALDPALGPRENMERYYRRARRIAESAARVEARAAEVRARVVALTALVAEVDQAGLEALPRLEREARRLAAGPRLAAAPRRQRDGPLPPYRAFRSLAGLRLLVGRGAAENDELTRRVARGNDLWLHARGRAGAHVVVRLGQAVLDQESLLDAAHLAAHFSDGRGEPQLEVAATRVKYLRKAKGAAPGAVTYSQEKVMLLRVEPARLARLLAEEEEAKA
jgi:predicted ribosome quality control (RQC) complex YloA/Tae2 family protein